MKSRNIFFILLLFISTHVIGTKLMAGEIERKAGMEATTYAHVFSSRVFEESKKGEEDTRLHTPRSVFEASLKGYEEGENVFTIYERKTLQSALEKSKERLLKALNLPSIHERYNPYALSIYGETLALAILNGNKDSFLKEIQDGGDYAALEEKRLDAELDAFNEDRDLPSESYATASPHARAYARLNNLSYFDYITSLVRNVMNPGSEMSVNDAVLKINTLHNECVKSRKRGGTPRRELQKIEKLLPFHPLNLQMVLSDFGVNLMVNTLKQKALGRLQEIICMDHVRNPMPSMVPLIKYLQEIGAKSELTVLEDVIFPALDARAKVLPDKELKGSAFEKAIRTNLPERHPFKVAGFEIKDKKRIQPTHMIKIKAVLYDMLKNIHHKDPTAITEESLSLVKENLSKEQPYMEELLGIFNAPS